MLNNTHTDRRAEGRRWNYENIFVNIFESWGRKLAYCWFDNNATLKSNYLFPQPLTQEIFGNSFNNRRRRNSTRHIPILCAQNKKQRFIYSTSKDRFPYIANKCCKALAMTKNTLSKRQVKYPTCNTTMKKTNRRILEDQKRPTDKTTTI